MSLYHSIKRRKWKRFGEAVGLDINKLEDDTPISTQKMPVSEFKKLLGIPGRIRGNYDTQGAFMAGGALL